MAEEDSTPATNSSTTDGPSAPPTKDELEFSRDGIRAGFLTCLPVALGVAGYGLVFGQTERKAIAMALVDRALRWKELGEEDQGAAAQDEEFVLMHADSIQATGFLEHIKLPHHVDFQSELELVRKLRHEASQRAAEGLEE